MARPSLRFTFISGPNNGVSIKCPLPGVTTSAWVPWIAAGMFSTEAYSAVASIHRLLPKRSYSGQASIQFSVSATPGT